MDLNVVKTQPADIEAHRKLFLAETKFQFVYNKCHGAGWTDDYLFTLNGRPIGYGSVWGRDKRDDRDTIREYFLEEPFRKHTRHIFKAFIKVSGARFIQWQTNDILLSNMSFELAKNIHAEAILFENAYETFYTIENARFVKTEQPDGWNNYSIQKDGETVATGGFVWNYNFPYIDMYYEVMEGFRKKGYGSLITQELKQEAYRLGRVPAARCNVNNEASRATLLKAGMKICGYILAGDV